MDLFYKKTGSKGKGKPYVAKISVGFKIEYSFHVNIHIILTQNASRLGCEFFLLRFSGSKSTDIIDRDIQAVF